MIKLRVIQQTAKIGKNKGKTIYRAVQTELPKLTMRAIEDRIVRTTSLSRGDIRNAITSLVEEVNQALQDGFCVDLGELGTFRPIASGKQCLNPDDAGAESIGKVKVRFTPRAVTKFYAKTASLEVDNEFSTKRKADDKPKQSAPATPKQDDDLMAGF